MSNMRIIKKYPNRRLYDTELSKYVTLEELKKLALSHTDFQVLDTQTQTDITNSVLLQIISELENQSVPIFTKNMLLNMIRYYGNPMQNALSEFLEQSVNLFSESQENMQKQFSDLTPSNPHDVMANLAKQNIAAWQNLFEKFFTPPSKSSEKTTKSKGE